MFSMLLSCYLESVAEFLGILERKTKLKGHHFGKTMLRLRGRMDVYTFRQKNCPYVMCIAAVFKMFTVRRNIAQNLIKYISPSRN